MPLWLGRTLQIVVPGLAVSVVGVVLGGLAKWAFDIPDDVAARAGGLIALAAMGVSLALVLFRWRRKQSGKAEPD